MFQFSKWCEFYFGNDINDFFIIQNLLRNEGIKFKTKTSNSADRFSRDIIMGASPFTLDRSGMNAPNNYTILIKETDELRARDLICKNK